MNKVSLTCESLDYMGRGICYLDSKTYFISNMLPGESGDCNIVVKKNFYEGYCYKLYNLSPDRSTYNWSSQTDLAHLVYNKQIDLQYLTTVRTFTKFKLNTNCITKPIFSPNNLYYRNKVTYFARNNPYLQFGSFENKTHQLEINDNITVPKIVSSFITKLNELLFDSKISDANCLKLIVRCNANDELMVVVIGKNNTLNSFLKDIILKNKSVKSVYLITNQNTFHIYGDKYLLDKIGDKKFYIGPTSFFQVNRFFTYLMYDEIKKCLDKKDNLLDLYSGMGTILTYVFDTINKGLGLEINKEAVTLGQMATTINNISNISIKHFDCKKFSIDSLKGYNCVTLDPPREGLSKEVVNLLLESKKIKKIIYFSCYLPTMCRDLTILSNSYDIKKIVPLSNFPHTSNYETLAILLLREKNN